ncbi:MAG: hypothetical protein K2L83_07890 [Muribaculaceae bacterium]|nr:hypothetical protein [Muribaculaceae bacterium]
MKRMRRLTIAAALAAAMLPAMAQKVYSTSDRYNADVKVYVVDREYQADLIVYKCKHNYEVDGNKGLWCFQDARYNADKTIYFTDHEYQADLKVYFTDRKYKAGWKNASKKYLMY